MSNFKFAVSAAVIVLFFAILIVRSISTRNDACEEAGGVLVKYPEEYVCEIDKSDLYNSASFGG